MGQKRLNYDTAQCRVNSRPSLGTAPNPKLSMF